MSDKETEDEIWSRRAVQMRIEGVRMFVEEAKAAIVRLEEAMDALEKSMGYQTGPESSREEMSPKENGTLDCPGAPVAPAAESQ